MKKMVKNNKGFTLIELVIVIAILGVLAAVAITMFPKLSASSRAGADKTRASQIKSAIATYIVESADSGALELGAAAVDASGISTNTGNAACDTILTRLQTGFKDSKGKDFDGYLENVDSAGLPKNYYPQEENKEWTITIDSKTGNVSVKSH